MSETSQARANTAFVWVTVAGWSALLGALLVLQRSRPNALSYDRFFGVHNRRRVWDAVGVDRAFWMILFALALGAVALWLAQRRGRAASVPWSALLLAIGSVAAFLGHLLTFD